MVLKTQFATYKNCFTQCARYSADNSLCVDLFNFEDGPIARLTVCLDDHGLADNESYLDTNNVPEAVSFVEENGLGTVTGRMGYSGFCAYPIVSWDMDKLGVCNGQ